MSIVPLPLPFQLANGSVADASQVMADLNYIAQQINANAGISGTVLNSINSNFQSYLSSVLVAGSGITLTTLNPGGAEQLQVNNTGPQLTVAQLTALTVTYG